ncbi:fibroblast growth factor receptor-like [Acanthaster planci]|uniref:Fibroblast growth factor receptor-like n=1 Tax=Acanthaster planci TaxID=133434 RepID=A0A8B7YUI6_ACAPL|nr:fibroblast growth factor receptor-like [Acanthaster planci]
MTRATYDSNYYRLSREGKMPVRWMAPESVNEGVFTTKSDIWSLGIVIYEVVTFGGFPYKELSNTDVLDFIRNNNAMRPPADCSPPLAALMQRCWSIEPEERPTANDVVEILSVQQDLIRPSMSKPVMSMLEEDPAQLLATPMSTRGARGDSLNSDSTGVDFGSSSLFRTEKVASLGRRLRASFARNLSWNGRRRSHSYTLHTMEMSGTEQHPKLCRELERSTQELVPSTLSVITCTTQSSLTSLNQSHRTSFRSTSAQRDSSSSSGVDCNITDGASAEIPVERQFSLRRSATDSDILDPTESKTSTRVPYGQTEGQNPVKPCSIDIQIGDELHLLPNQQRMRQHKRSRSRSLGNLRSPCTPRKLFKGSCVDSQVNTKSSV